MIMAAVCAPIVYVLSGHSILLLIITPLVGAIVYGGAAYALNVAKLRSELLGAGLIQIRALLARSAYARRSGRLEW